MAIAILWGTYVGTTYSYPSFFGGGDLRIYPLLIWPSAVIGVVSGWKFLINCPFLHLYVATLFFGRALLGRELWWDYVVFVFRLTFGGVANVVPYSFGWSCASALFGWLAVKIYRKMRGPNQALHGIFQPADGLKKP